MLVVHPAPAAALSPGSLVAALLVLMWAAALAIRSRGDLGVREDETVGAE